MDDHVAVFPALCSSPCRYGFGLGGLLDLPHTVVGGKDRTFIHVSASVHFGTALGFAPLPNAYRRVRSVPVGNGVVDIDLGVVEPDCADVARVEAEHELALVLGYHRVWCVDPAAQHVVIVVDLVDHHAVVLYRAFFVGHQVEPQPVLVGYSCRQAAAGCVLGAEDALAVFLHRRHV